MKTLSPDMPAALRNKIAVRIIPLLCLMYVLNIMDRMNVGYARSKMEIDLGMDSFVFSVGFGIFYLGYLLFEVPANLILQRVGARRWMARIMISWGLVSCVTAAVTGPISFYAVRILLGIAEAGFFPGIVLYLTYWFPARERGKAMALFMTGVAISGVVSNPISGAIMQYMPGIGGLRGWQWLFILEGIPSVLVGLTVFYFLPDGPRDAKWLTEQERDELTERLRQEDEHRQKSHGGDMWRAARDWRIWLFTAVYFTVSLTANCGGASFAKMIQYRFWDFGGLLQGCLVALPSLCALFGMIILGQVSDLTKMRRATFALAGLLGAAGWAGALLDGQAWPLPVATPGAPPIIGDQPGQMASRWLFLASLCLAQIGMFSMIPTFWVLPTAFLTGTAAAAGIALINSIGNVAGWVGPPYIHEQFGNGSMLVALLLGSAGVFLIRHDPTLDRRGVPICERKPAV